MPGATTNFKLPIALGSDLYNHLTIDNAAYQKIDEQMFKNQNAAFSTATHTKSGNTHVIVRNIPTCAVFWFTATDDYRTGEPITVNGNSVSARLPTGAGLPDYCWRINSKVICIVEGSAMTVFSTVSSSDAAASAYPVGSVFISTVATSPATLLGFGSWERIQGRFLFASDSTHAAGTTGGEEKHTLTVAELPVHDHQSGSAGGYYLYGGDGTSDGPAAGQGYRTAITSQRTSTTGSGVAHNNMPPYLSVYMWKRTA